MPPVTRAASRNTYSRKEAWAGAVTAGGSGRSLATHLDQEVEAEAEREHEDGQRGGEGQAAGGGHLQLGEERGPGAGAGQQVSHGPASGGQ